jgi:flagellar basal-body rod modification protein FlgD
MAINSVGENLALYGEKNIVEETENKGILGKDDFMKLLLVQLQHQDPTEPMDSEKILTQTSQLAGLEASANTNKALEDLAKSLSNTQQFTTISAIGKTADLGSDAIAFDEGSTSTFEVYFPNDIQEGTVSITDNSGNLVQTIDVGTNPKGVYQFEWNGLSSGGNPVESGIYHVNASYADQSGAAQQTRLGAYPIESVRFDGGQTLVKVGSNYVPLSDVKEVY